MSTVITVDPELTAAELPTTSEGGDTAFGETPALSTGVSARMGATLVPEDVTGARTEVRARRGATLSP